jgi:hypothetical protein
MICKSSDWLFYFIYGSGIGSGNYLIDFSKSPAKREVQKRTIYLIFFLFLALVPLIEAS